MEAKCFWRATIVKTVIILTEGQCEETFVRDVLAPDFWQLDIYLESRCIPTSKSAKGGAVNFERFLSYARKTILERNDTYISSMLDLYALDRGFPGFDEAMKLNDIYQKTSLLESALHKKVIDLVACRTDRFIPYIQPYEFEGLLFSSVEKLVMTEPDWERHLPHLEDIRKEFETPEHINNSYDTKPSIRLEKCLRPKYRKTTHGPRGAKIIGLETIEKECLHFHQWLEKIRNL